MRRTFNYIDAEQRALTAPVPERTETYVPIPHSTFITLLKSEIERAGFSITKAKYLTNENGQKLIGLYNLVDTNSPRVATEEEFGMMIGFRNSYDKSMTAALVAGATVFVCENGVVAGSMINFRRKHTGNIEQLLKDKINKVVYDSLANFVQIALEIEAIKSIQVTQRQKAEILGRLYFEEDVLSPTQMTIVKRELEHSKHFTGNSLWSLYNNVTEALKTSHPTNYFEKHLKLHEFMARYAGIAPEVTITENEEVEEPVQTSAETIESARTEGMSIGEPERVTESPTTRLSDLVPGGPLLEEDEGDEIYDDEEEEEEGYDENQGEGRDAI